VTEPALNIPLIPLPIKSGWKSEKSPIGPGWIDKDLAGELLMQFRT
jgi:hypothetical protein